MAKTYVAQLQVYFTGEESWARGNAQAILAQAGYSEKPFGRIGGQ